MQAPNSSILLRFSGELTTKGKVTRKHFEERLFHNLREALASVDVRCKITRHRERFIIAGGGLEAAQAVSQVFGVQSVALSERSDAPHLDAVVKEGTRRFAKAVAGRRFAVRARRVGGRTRTPISGQAVERALGEALLVHAERVDLDHPEITARLELLGDSAYWITREIPGPAGLPLGVEGRALALLSGGFDSAVAAWQLMRRGVRLDFLVCLLGGEEHLRAVFRVAKHLATHWCHGAMPKLIVVDFEDVAKEIRDRIDPRYWQVVLKREMVRAATRAAHATRAEGLVMGDALGQVSSQTLTNIDTVSRATSLPILRPLVGSNKDEILRAAEHIGTATLSAGVEEYCAMATRRPATAARERDVVGAEAHLNPAVLENAVTHRALFDLRLVELQKKTEPELAVASLPAGATAIDLRDKNAYENWHLPDALHLDFDRAVVAYPSFDRERVYLLYCEIGLMSAHLAHLMRSAGFRVAHLSGGARTARRRERADATSQ